MAGIRNADDNLAQLRKALDDLGLSASTNVIVSSDHGFSTISKESKTSPSAKMSYSDTPKDFLPMGFLAIDLAKALNLPLFDPNDKNAKIGDNAHPKAGNGVLGQRSQLLGCGAQPQLARCEGTQGIRVVLNQRVADGLGSGPQRAIVDALHRGRIAHVDFGTRPFVIGSRRRPTPPTNEWRKRCSMCS